MEHAKHGQFKQKVHSALNIYHATVRPDWTAAVGQDRTTVAKSLNTTVTRHTVSHDEGHQAGKRAGGPKT